MEDHCHDSSPSFLIASDPIAPGQPTDAESIRTQVLELRETALFEEQSGCFGQAEVLWREATGLAERYLPGTQLHAQVAIDAGKFISRFLPRSQIPIKYLRAGLSLSHLLDASEVVSATLTVAKCLIGWNDFRQAEDVLSQIDRSDPEIDVRVQCYFGMLEHEKQDIPKAESILREAVERAQPLHPELHAECVVHLCGVLLDKEEYLECQCHLPQVVQFLVSCQSSLLHYALCLLMKTYVDTNQFKLLDSMLEAVIEQLKAAKASNYAIAEVLTEWGDYYSKVSPTCAILRYIQSLRLYQSVRQPSWYIVRMLHKIIKNQGESRCLMTYEHSNAPQHPVLPLAEPLLSETSFRQHKIPIAAMTPVVRRLYEFSVYKPPSGRPVAGSPGIPPVFTPSIGPMILGPSGGPPKFGPYSQRPNLSDLVSTTSLASLEEALRELPAAATAMCVCFPAMHQVSTGFTFGNCTCLKKKVELLLCSSDDIEYGEALLYLADIHYSKKMEEYMESHPDCLIFARLLMSIGERKDLQILKLRRTGICEFEIYNNYKKRGFSYEPSERNPRKLSKSLRACDVMIDWNFDIEAFKMAETINPFSSRYFEVVFRSGLIQSPEETFTRVLQANSGSPLPSQIIEKVQSNWYLERVLRDVDATSRRVEVARIVDTLACIPPIHIAFLDVAISNLYSTIHLTSLFKRILIFCVDSVKSIAAHYRLLEDELNWFYKKQMNLVLSGSPPQLLIEKTLSNSEEFSQRYDYRECLATRVYAAVGSLKYKECTEVNLYFKFLRELYGK